MFLQAGLTSLILAVQNQHVEVVEALLNVHCNPNITENVSIEWEMVAALFVDIFISLHADSLLERTAFCRKVSKSSHH